MLGLVLVLSITEAKVLLTLLLEGVMISVSGFLKVSRIITFSFETLQNSETSNLHYLHDRN